MDENSVDRIMQSVQGGGYVNPMALAVAIRAAAKECMDTKGNLSLATLYELTCQLEKKEKGDIIDRNI